jgi:hypothetical protein
MIARRLNEPDFYSQEREPLLHHRPQAFIWEPGLMQESMKQAFQHYELPHGTGALQGGMRMHGDCQNLSVWSLKVSYWENQGCAGKVLSRRRSLKTVEFDPEGHLTYVTWVCGP